MFEIANKELEGAIKLWLNDIRKFVRETIKGYDYLRNSSFFLGSSLRNNIYELNANIAKIIIHLKNIRVPDITRNLEK